MTETIRRRAVECLLVSVVFVVATDMGVRYLGEQRPNPFLDFLSRAAMVACGHGFTAPGESTPEFLAFYGRQSSSVTCAEVAGVLPPTPAGAFADSHRNLIYATTAAIRIGGLNWSTLDWFVAAWFGLSMALFYGLLRLGLDRSLSLIGVLLLGCSDHIFQLANLRDYSKAPCFFAVWLALGWMLRRRGDRASRGLLLPAVVGGVVIGVGVGFRVDLMACVPAFPLVLAFAIAGSDRRAMIMKGLAIGAFLVAFVLTGYPTLQALNRGSNAAHHAVLGLTNAFTKDLGIEPPLYDFGGIYADGYGHALISAHAVAVQHDPKKAALGSVEYDRQGFAFLLHNALRFPADQVIRMAGATVQAIRYPFKEASRGAYLKSTTLSQTEPLATLSRWRGTVLGWVDGYAPYLAALVLAIIFARDWRLGAAVLLLTSYFGGIAMIQYSRRHTFHLDVVPIASLVVAVHAALAIVLAVMARWRGLRTDKETAPPAPQRHLLRLAGLGAFVILGAGSLLLLRAWQQQHVAAGLDRTFALAWQPLSTTTEPLAFRRDGVVIDPGWYAIYETNPERWGQPLTLLRVSADEAAGSLAATTNPIRSEYLRVEVGGEACRLDSVSIGMKYNGPVASLDWEYTRTFELPLVDPQDKTVLLAPAIYWKGSSTFDGFVVPTDQASCVLGVSRAPANDDVPFPFLAMVLPPTWRTLPLYQRLAP